MDLTSILLLKLSDTMCAIAKVKVKKQDTKKALSFTVHGVSMDSVRCISCFSPQGVLQAMTNKFIGRVYFFLPPSLLE